MATDVVVLKLSTGEELIGYEEQITAENITMTKARALIVGGQAPDGRVALRMIPWLLASPDAEIVIDRNHVISRVHEKALPKDAVDGYRQSVTKIQLAAADSGLIKSK